MPMRTWLPLTPSTVTVTASPIIRVSPTRRVRISMGVLSLADALGVGICSRARDSHANSGGNEKCVLPGPCAASEGSHGSGFAQSAGNPFRHSLECRSQRGAVIAAALRHVRAATALAVDLSRHMGEQLAGLDPALRGAAHARHQGSLAVARTRQDDDGIAQLVLEPVQRVAQRL